MKRLNPDEIRADIQRQVRRMGARDYFAGEPECPFGEKSLAATHWREGLQKRSGFRYFIWRQRVKERPILFSSEMVKAILAGRKTQTRRIFKGLTPPDCIGNHSCVVEDGAAKFHLNERLAMHEGEWTKCPYGYPGDRLWVRETWRPVGPWECRDDKATVQYRADGEYRRRTGWPSEFRIKTTDGADKWRPSIFMPRWASRITLEITDVRVERLQDISEADAIAEGVEPVVFTAQDIEDTPADTEEGQLLRHLGPGQLTAKSNFQVLWDEINGKRASWASNPWVWVVEFRVEATGLPTVEAA